MLTPFSLRGRAVIASFVLWLCAASVAHTQDILKELEQSEQQQGDEHAGHGRDAMSGVKKTSTKPKEHGGHKHATSASGAHSGHKHTTRHNAKEHGNHQHIASHTQSHTGEEMHQ